LKTHATSPTMTTNFGLGRESEHHAAHSSSPCTTAGPETPAVKSHLSRPNHADSAIRPSQSPLEGIADLLDNLPSQVCFQLTRRLLTIASSHPTGTGRTKSCPKNRYPLYSCV
jgi:hypothetical protein